MIIMKNILLGISLALVLYSCKSESEKTIEIIINSIGKEWRLDKVNGKSPRNYKTRHFLTFHNDFTYEIYTKKNGFRLPKVYTDNIREYKWSVDENGKLEIDVIHKMERVSLEHNNHLIIEYLKLKFEFVCDSCEKI